jgi:hypothetical protein
MSERRPLENARRMLRDGRGPLENERRMLRDGRGPLENARRMPRDERRPRREAAAPGRRCLGRKSRNRKLRFTS